MDKKSTNVKSPEIGRFKLFSEAVRGVSPSTEIAKSVAVLIVIIALSSAGILAYLDSAPTVPATLAADVDSEIIQIRDAEDGWGEDVTNSFYVEDWLPGGSYSGWVGIRNVSGENVEEIEMQWKKVEDEDDLSTQILVETILYGPPEDPFDITSHVEESLEVDELRLVHLFEDNVKLKEMLELAGGEGELQPEGVENLIIDFVFDPDAGNQYQGSRTLADVKFTATISDLSEFEVGNLEVDPEEVGPGDTVKVTADITNVGEETGRREVEFSVEGSLEDSVTVELEPGETETVEFETSRNEVGEYDVKIDAQDDFETGSFTVEGEEDVDVAEEYDLTIHVAGEGTTEPEPGTHIYGEGEEVTVRAIPEEGWEFVGWTGDETGEERTLSFEMDEDKEIFANFERERFDLTFEVVDENGNPLEDAEVWVGGPVDEVKRTDENGSVTFEGLIPGTYEYVVDREGFVPVDGDVTVDDEDVTETVNLSEGVVVDVTVVTQPDLTYERGDELDLSGLEVTLTWSDTTVRENIPYENFGEYGLTAVPDDGTELGEGHDGKPVLIVHEPSGENAETDPLTVLQPAFFQVDIVEAEPVVEGEDLMVLVEVTNLGEVEGTRVVELLDFENNVVDSILVTLGPGEGREVTLTWPTEVGDAGTGDVTVRSEDDEDSVEVTVEVKTYNLTFEVVDEDGEPVDGALIELNGMEGATDEDGRAVFENLPPRDYEYTVSKEGHVTVEDVATILDEHVSVTVISERAVTYDLTVSVQGQGTVRVDEFEVTDEDTFTFEEGIEVELEAVPADGWVFDGWSGDVEGEAETVTVTMDDDKEVTAVFETIPFPPWWLILLALIPLILIPLLLLWRRGEPHIAVLVENGAEKEVAGKMSSMSGIKSAEVVEGEEEFDVVATVEDVDEVDEALLGKVRSLVGVIRVWPVGELKKKMEGKS